MPNLSESVAVPANLRSEIAVDSVMPFVIDANPEIAALGVKLLSEIIAIRFPSLNNLVTFLSVSVLSVIVSNVKPFVFAPADVLGPISILDVPL